MKGLCRKIEIKMGNGASQVNAVTRTIFVELSGKVEKVKFNQYSSSHDIIQMIATAAGANRYGTDILVKDQAGALVSIGPMMPINDSSSPYKVIVPKVSKTSNDQSSDSPKQLQVSVVQDQEALKHTLNQVTETLQKAFKLDEVRSELMGKISSLERRLEVEGLKKVEIDKCKKDLNELREVIDASRGRSPNSPNAITAGDKIKNSSNSSSLDSNNLDKKITLRRDVPAYPKYTLSQETVAYLKKPTFDIWHWEANEMLSLLEHMYHELGLVEEFNINPIILKRWLLCVQENYRNNPFHNFRHCFCVTQMMYGMIHLCNLQEKMSKYELGILITACVCHDLDHPGYNNTYQINARTELAIRYNDISPLENHHCAVAFQIFSNPETNIFGNVSDGDFKKIRQGIIMLILATDMARHSEILEAYKAKKQHFDFKNEDHLNSLKMILIKCCDISNEVRPMEVSEPWVDCLLEEYFNQSDREKSEGLPVAPFMDRDKVTKPTAQIGFIKFVLIPMFESLLDLFPNLEEILVNPLRQARDHYEEMKRKQDEEVPVVPAQDKAEVEKAKKENAENSKKEPA